MANPIKPEVGGWYQTDQGERFEVVASDESDATIEIQYFNGDVEELDLETWNELTAKAIRAPEDWSGPFDDLERDDFGDTERPYHPQDWQSPVDSIESDVSDMDWDE